MVRSLSEATSTAIALVAEVIVARIRFWCTPWPSWTSECLLSRIQGMSRDIASSRIACVDGPNAVRSARRMNASSSSSQSKLGVGLDEVVDQAYGEPGGGQADLLVDVPVDDVVAALLALDLAGLAAADVVARPSCCRASATCSVTCPSQVPSLSRSTKPPRRPREHECSRSPGSIGRRWSVKPGSVLVG